MKVNGKEYRYRIEPRFGKVYAEIFCIYKIESEHEMHLISKSFKKWYKPIQDSDYSNAKEWAENHLENMKKNNK